MDLAYFDAVGKAKTPKDPIEPPRYAGFACEPTRPPLSDHVTPRLRITSVTASVAASVEAGGSEGGPAETCAEKVVTAPPDATATSYMRPPGARRACSDGLPQANRAAARCGWRVAAVMRGLWPPLSIPP